MHNFVDPKLSPRVSTSSAALDDYEISNLISDDPMVRARGYIAFTSIKPPVDVFFQFICNINIKFIKLTTKLGSNKTIGVEVLSGDALTSLGKQIYDTDGLIMCNSRYRLKPQNQQYHKTYLRSNHYKIFTNTNSLCIRLLRTDARSVPCLGAVEVWGYVANSCSNETKQTVYKLINNNRVNSVQCARTNSIIALNQKNNTFEIPEDFKDALTFEVMAMPMTLPSGNSVDQKTVEKCISNDVTYGRKPADPFTGLEFLPNRKPILNVALKSRIDLFLLQNSNLTETFSISRTLGTNAIAIVEPVPSKKPKLECEPSTGDNLDVAIAKVLSNSGFMCFTNSNSTQQTFNKSCDKCSTKSHLYVIKSCNHLYCKPCLLQLNNVCRKCKIKFDNNAVVKLNF